MSVSWSTFIRFAMIRLVRTNRSFPVCPSHHIDSRFFFRPCDSLTRLLERPLLPSSHKEAFRRQPTRTLVVVVHYPMPQISAKVVPRLLHSIVAPMCRGTDVDGPSKEVSGVERIVGVANDATTTTKASTVVQAGAAFISNVFIKHRKHFLWFLATCFMLSVLGFSYLYVFHHGFRRTVHFWKGTLAWTMIQRISTMTSLLTISLVLSPTLHLLLVGMGPLLAEYRLLKFRYRNVPDDDEVYAAKLHAYNVKTAPKLVNLMLQMGGIYIKLGQVMSTIGQGLLPPEYTEALQPLQNGVPARDYEDISNIIEQSTGKNMTDIFQSFEKTPIGAASVAQAHRATLINGEKVIVKVQYPEVADLFDADLTNMEIATRLFSPNNVKTAQALRERHERELDFRIEAQNLIECANNLQQHGVEPALVRIPRVKNETGICNQHVLVMEYLEGTPLSDVIREEQDRIASALGKKDSTELRDMLRDRMREHFEKGGGPGEGGMQLVGGGKARLFQVAGPIAARMLRTYATVKDQSDRFFGMLQYRLATAFRTNNDPDTRNLAPTGKARRGQRVNLDRALKTLVYVHGLQFLKDGMYNADPHPGNVLILPDNRLGLLDYGMVGYLDSDERQSVAKTVVALANKQKKTAANVYLEQGYRVENRTDGSEVTDYNLLHRFATFHLDRIDLSPIRLADGTSMPMMDVFRTVRETSTPNWVEQSRRLAGLLMGVNAQAARPASIAHVWGPIAREVLDKPEKTKVGRKRTE